jgi:hypothetical protein
MGSGLLKTKNVAGDDVSKFRRELKTWFVGTFLKAQVFFRQTASCRLVREGFTYIL